MAECAERVFQNQVRVGIPTGVIGLTDHVYSPYHATAVGLLHYGKNNLMNEPSEPEPKRSVSGMFSRLTGWLRKEF